MEGTRNRRRDVVEGDFNVGPRGGEVRQAGRRDRRECRESVGEGKVQNGRAVTFETIQQQEGARRRRMLSMGGGAGGEEEGPMRTAFFWVTTQRVVVISYRRFEAHLEP
jgi:hypothetical protein